MCSCVVFETASTRFRTWVADVLLAEEGETIVKPAVPIDQPAIARGAIDCCCGGDVIPSSCNGTSCDDVECSVPACVDCRGNDCTEVVKDYLNDGMCGVVQCLCVCMFFAPNHAHRQRTLIHLCQSVRMPWHTYSLAAAA